MRRARYPFFFSSNRVCPCFCFKRNTATGRQRQLTWRCNLNRIICSSSECFMINIFIVNAWLCTTWEVEPLNVFFSQAVWSLEKNSRPTCGGCSCGEGGEEEKACKSPHRTALITQTSCDLHTCGWCRLPEVAGQNAPCWLMWHREQTVRWCSSEAVITSVNVDRPSSNLTAGSAGSAVIGGKVKMLLMLIRLH